MAFDLVIRNGTVIDGTGTPGFDSDVAIENGKIAAIGKNLGPATNESTRAVTSSRQVSSMPTPIWTSSSCSIPTATLL